jgi:calcium-dependent protein kinase
LCTGGELFDKISKMGHFTEKMASSYMFEILSAVYYWHSNKIVHRDLKPENILLENENENAHLKIIDFGTSVTFDPKRKMKTVLGTPYYVAPDVLKGRYNEKCDVWSMGVIMYILLCGYPPFPGKSNEEIFQKIINSPVNFSGVNWSSVSYEAKNLVNLML